MIKLSGNNWFTFLSDLEKSSDQTFAVMAEDSTARILKNKQKVAYIISFPIILQTRSSSNIFHVC